MLARFGSQAFLLWMFLSLLCLRDGTPKFVCYERLAIVEVARMLIRRRMIDLVALNIRKEKKYVPDSGKGVDTMATNQEGLTSQRSVQTNPWRTDMKLLFIAAMIVFLITVAIGLVNGQHLVTLSQDVLLTHVHAGTIGWITLSVFALTLFLFGDGEVSQGTKSYIRWSSIIAAISVPLYILAFLSGIPLARAILGVPVLLVMAAFLVWIIARSSKIHLGVAQLAVLGSLVTLVIAGTLGVLMQVQFASARAFLPGGDVAAHAATMVSGYLVLIGMALSEWRLMPPSGRVSRAGIIQVTLLFLAGLAMFVGQLFDLQPFLMLNLLLSVIGVIIYIVRFAPRIVRLNWLGHNSERFFAISAIFVVINIALTVYLIAAIIAGAIPGNPPPSGLLHALDHAIFVGVMTNAIFGLLHDTTQERRALWPWAEDVLFWGMNIGLVGFLVGLLSGVQILQSIFTPIMGLSILVGLLMIGLRMRKSPQAEPIEAQASAD